jgi:O-antigen/teichoic acid export membrane protein
MTAPPSKASMIRNTLYAVAGHLVSFGVPVIVTPYVVFRLGLDVYGLWVALNALAVWLGRSDLGLWAVLGREVAHRRALEDRGALRSLMATWFVYDLAAGAAVLAGVALAGDLLLGLFTPGADREQFRPVLLALAVQSSLAAPLRHLLRSVEGFQRLDLANRVTVAAALLWAGAVVVVLESGGGLRGLAWNGTAFALLQIVSLVAVLRGIGYPVGFRLRDFRGGELRRLLGAGWTLEGQQVLLQVFRSDRLLLSATGLAPALLAFYQFGATVADRLGATVGTLSSAVLPAASDLAARGDREKVNTLLMRGTKYHALAGAVVIGFAALFGHELLALWMGRPLPEAVWVLRLAAGGALAWSVGSCAQAVGVSLGRPGLSLAATAAGLGGALLLYFTLGRRYDYGGLAGSVSTGLVLGWLIYMVGLHGILGFRWREYVGNSLLKPAVLALPLAAVWGAWRLLAPHTAPVEGRTAALAVLAPAFLVSVAACAGVARACRIVDDYDLSLLRSIGRRSRA